MDTSCHQSGEGPAGAAAARKHREPRRHWLECPEYYDWQKTSCRRLGRGMSDFTLPCKASCRWCSWWRCRSVNCPQKTTSSTNAIRDSAAQSTSARYAAGSSSTGPAAAEGELCSSSLSDMLLHVHEQDSYSEQQALPVAQCVCVFLCHLATPQLQHSSMCCGSVLPVLL